MSETDTILAAVYAVINMLIPIIIGILLTKLNVLTVSSRKIISDVNYYVFVPMYGLFYVMKAVDRERLNELGLLLFSLVPCVFIGLIITLTIAKICNFDYRIRCAFACVNVYGNVVVMPQMLGSTLCDKGGKYNETSQCKLGLVNAYTSVPLIFINICYWASVLPLLQEEKRLSLEMKKVTLVALNFYNSVADFLKDRSSSFQNASFIGKRPEIPEEVHRSIDNVNNGSVVVPFSDRDLIPQEHSHRETNTNLVNLNREIKSREQNYIDNSINKQKYVSSNDEIFINEFYQFEMQKSDYEERKEAYEEFEAKFLDLPRNFQLKADLIKEVFEPEKITELPKEEQIFSLDFLKRRILLAPPTIFSLLGLALGFIFPFKEWLYDPNRKPLPTFLNTCQTIGAMMSPISMFLLGTYLAQSALIAKDMLISWKHVIWSNILKNLLIPALGLFWILIVMKNTSEDTFKANPLLIFIDYMDWIVPNGLVLISVYVYADYFAREFAVFSIYMNLIAIPMMAVWMIVYFTLYEKAIA